MKIQFVTQRSKRCRGIRILLSKPGAARVFSSQDFENFFTCPQNLLPVFPHCLQIRFRQFLGFLAPRPGTICCVAWFHCQHRRGKRTTRRRRVTGYLAVCARNVGAHPELKEETKIDAHRCVKRFWKIHEEKMKRFLLQAQMIASSYPWELR